MNGKPFNAGEPLAYFLTWTTYGTWLPGDKRWWKRNDMPGDQPPDSIAFDSAKSQLKETAFLMGPEHRRIVEQTIRRHCQIRAWKLHAVNARLNHVHVVVSAKGYLPETVRDQFKSWCTRLLKQSVNDRERFWTEGAGCRWIDHDEDLNSAVVYTLETQDWVEDHSLQGSKNAGSLAGASG